MTNIDFTSTPADIFKAAAKVTHLAAAKLEEAKRTIAPAQTAYDNAAANLQWVAAHPGLAEVDKNALYQEAVTELSATDAPEESKPAEAVVEDKPVAAEPPKRKRRTKAEMEAARAAEAATLNPPANESDDAAQQVEGEGVSRRLDETFVEEAAAYTSVAQPVSDPFPAAPAAPVAAPTAAPAPAPAAAVPTDPFDPFGVAGQQG